MPWGVADTGELSDTRDCTVVGDFDDLSSIGSLSRFLVDISSADEWLFIALGSYKWRSDCIRKSTFE